MLLHDSSQTFRAIWSYEETAPIPEYSYKKNLAGELDC